MIILFQYRDSASTGSDYDLISIQKCVDCIQFHDLHRMRSGNDSSESFSGFFDHIISFFTLFVGLFCAHVTSENFGWCIESLVIRIYDHLCQYSADCTVDSAVHQFFPDSVLEIVSDIALAHGRTYRHRCSCIIFMTLSEFIHGSVDHPYLWSIAVGDRNLKSGFDQICDYF